MLDVSDPDLHCHTGGSFHQFSHRLPKRSFHLRCGEILGAFISIAQDFATSRCIFGLAGCLSLGLQVIFSCVNVDHDAAISSRRRGLPSATACTSPGSATFASKHLMGIPNPGRLPETLEPSQRFDVGLWGTFFSGSLHRKSRIHRLFFGFFQKHGAPPPRKSSKWHRQGAVVADLKTCGS